MEQKKTRHRFTRTRWSGCGKMSGTHWYNIKSHAKIKDRDFDLTKEYVWELYEKQGGLCALTKIPIDFATDVEMDYGKQQTASLDRIDSAKGYTQDNVQWVHKTVNKMKTNLDQAEFIKFCKLVANGEENG